MHIVYFCEMPFCYQQDTFRIVLRCWFSGN